MQTEKNKPYNGDLKTKGTVKSRHRVGIVCFKKQLSYSRIKLEHKIDFFFMCPCFDFRDYTGIRISSKESVT